MICSVRELEARISEGQLAAPQVKEAFAQVFLPAMLFPHDIQTMPAIYSELRD